MNGFHVAPIPSPDVRSIVPCLASADRQNSSHHQTFNTTCRTLHPLIDRTPVTTKRSTQRPMPCIR